MRDNKAFTLIELLVVVAIIGILAAVGVVAYNGYTSSAKVAATKANHKTVVKYITAELMKCTLGEVHAMDNKLTCSQRLTTNAVSGGVYRALMDSVKNPYSPNNYSVSSSGNYSKPGNEGYVAVWQSGSTVTVITCYQSPCASDDRLTNIINIE